MPKRIIASTSAGSVLLAGLLLALVPSAAAARGTGGRGGPIPMGRLPNGSSWPLSVFVDGNFPWASSTGIDDVITAFGTKI